MAFEKGKPRLPNAGRKAGTPNKVTATVRETFLKVFGELQSDPKANLLVWAQGNPTEFYKLSSKLIPVDMAVQGGLTLNVVTGVPRPADNNADLV